MLYDFENRIVLGDKKFDSSDKNRELYQSGTVIVTLTPEFSTQGFKGADWIMLRGQGYPSSKAAYDAGKIWRQQLSVAFANARIAADFDAMPVEHREHDREPSPEAPGLRVYPQPTGIGVRFSGRAVGHSPESLDWFLSTVLPSVQQSIPNGFDRRLELAYATLHLALAKTSPEIKYVMFVTAIEAIIEEREKPKDILGALTALQKYVADPSTDFAPSVKKRLRDILEDDKEESINQLGAELASALEGTYAGKTPAKFFKHVYGGRSAIVHGEIEFTGRRKGKRKRKRPTAQEIADTLPELRRFVFDLLTAAIVSVTGKVPSVPCY